MLNKRQRACWRVHHCRKRTCPAYGKKQVVCWLISGTNCHRAKFTSLREKFRTHCLSCKVYRSAAKRKPHGALLRLGLCLQAVERSRAHGERTISSRYLAMAVRTNRAQVRKDFSKFQIGCDSGSGYDTHVLEKQLRRALCVHKPIPAVMIGCGNWARALLANPALSARGTFVIKRVYSPIRINEVKTVSGHRVHSPTRLARYLEKEQIRAVVVASPAPEVKHLFGVLEFSPVVVLLNFSPFRPELTPGIKVFSFDLQVRLDLAAYHVANAEIPVVPENALL